MPKENTACTVMPGFRVEVGWTRGRDVQIATTNTNSPLRVEAPEAKDDTDTMPFDGWHCTLDRNGINKLIRNLRRARDAAYGSDA